MIVSIRLKTPKTKQNKTKGIVSLLHFLYGHKSSQLVYLPEFKGAQRKCFISYCDFSKPSQWT